MTCSSINWCCMFLFDPDISPWICSHLGVGTPVVDHAAALLVPAVGEGSTGGAGGTGGSTDQPGSHSAGTLVWHNKRLPWSSQLEILSADVWDRIQEPQLVWDGCCLGFSHCWFFPTSYYHYLHYRCYNATTTTTATTTTRVGWGITPRWGKKPTRVFLFVRSNTRNHGIYVTCLPNSIAEYQEGKVKPLGSQGEKVIYNILCLFL